MGINTYLNTYSLLASRYPSLLRSLAIAYRYRSLVAKQMGSGLEEISQRQSGGSLKAGNAG